MALDTLEIFGDEFTNVAGIKATDDQSGTKVYIRPQGTKNISANGTGIDVTSYASVDVAVPSSTPTLQTITKTYTPSTSAVTDTITPSSGYDGIEEVDVTVSAVPTFSGAIDIDAGGFSTVSNQRKWKVRGWVSADIGEDGYIGEGDEYGEYTYYNAVQSGTTVTPTESSQTIGEANTMMEGAVTVNAIPSNYVGSGITRRSSSDLSASGATVTVPSGYYSAQASEAVASGTAGTPTATKGTVSNHSISVTPSVTNTEGYISGGTINGTAVTVTASELVSGSDTVTTNDTYDVTNLAQLIVNVSGSGGLEYETGTLTPTSDASTPIIEFSNTHTDIPSYINIVDTTGTTATSSSCLYWTFMNWYTAFGAVVKTTNSANMYGRYQYGYKSSSGASAGNIDCTNTGSSSGGLYYLVSTDRFGPYCGSGNRYWRSGRTYKWIAVWAPPTT